MPEQLQNETVSCPQCGHELDLPPPLIDALGANALAAEVSAEHVTIQHKPPRRQAIPTTSGKSRYIVPGKPDIVIYRHNMPQTSQKNGTVALLLKLRPFKKSGKR